MNFKKKRFNLLTLINLRLFCKVSLIELYDVQYLVNSIVGVLCWGSAMGNSHQQEVKKSTYFHLWVTSCP